MPRPSRATEIEHALLEHVESHPKDLVRVVADQLHLSRAAVAEHARALLSAKYLEKLGTTRPAYRRGSSRRALIEHHLKGLAEDRVWMLDVAPLLANLPPNVLDICHLGLTEMVNNAIDHSEGTQLQVFVDRNPTRVAMSVADDGIGIFRKITRALDLPDPRLALLELSKGKLTTDPRRHSGEGVFFTSRMFDRFQIASGDLVFDHDDAEAQDVLFDIDPRFVAHGTTVLMEISADSKQTAKQVYDEFSSGPDEYAFAKTVVPVRLARVGDENLVSRSQAKRLLQRVERFRTVVLDFETVESVGQGFSDEIFRVFANEHPNVELIALHAVPAVQQMIRRAQTLRGEDGDQLPLL